MSLKKLYAEHAWLGPGRFARRVLIEFDEVVRAVVELRPEEQPPADASRVGWLIPGMVNAHCHLEYSWLRGELPQGNVPFGEWMGAIMRRGPSGAEEMERRNAAMAAAAQTLLTGGCTTVFDSTTDGASGEILRRSGLRYFLFHEALGLTRERAEPIWRGALERCAAGNMSEGGNGGGCMGSGLNPHAPYSVGDWLREQLRGEEAAHWPHAWHLAETEDEEQLFQRGEGSIAGCLREFGLPLPQGRWRSAWDFLKSEGLLGRCQLVFHGNRFSLNEAEFFATPRGVVHCPGTHRWFEREPAPLGEWLRCGVNVCLGTDSLASADTLSMLDVVRMTLEDHPYLGVDEVLTMACVNPWRLGFMAADGPIGGRIEVGAMADLVALEVCGNAGSEMEEGWGIVLENSSAKQAKVWIGGEPG